jgi:[acyl-carrier-protein] S-malonyltransferase
MKIAFLFVGQGSQKVGMGQSVYATYPQAQAVYDHCAVDFDVKSVCFNGPEATLNDTAITQVCLLVTSLAISEALRAEGIVAQGVAGLSLGEYSALTYANAFTVDTAIRVVRQRGQLMASALPQGSSGMSAILTDRQVLLEEILSQDHGGIVEVANYNSPQQTVISGQWDALKSAESALKAHGVSRIIPLKVSGAFHTSLLKPASNALAEILQKVTVNPPTIPVYFNISGRPESELKAALTAQICSSVQWVKTLTTMINEGFDTFIEVGPGKTLAGLVRQIDPSVRVYSVESAESITALKGELYG